MTNSRKSVSPTTEVSSEETDSDKTSNTSTPIVSTLKSIYNYFRDKVPQSSTFKGVDTKVSFPGYSDVKMVVDEPLLHNFSSEKRRRLSAAAHLSNGNVPRSSSLSNNLGLYQSYRNNIQINEEERNNDLERRLSTSYGDAIVKNTVSQYIEVPRVVSGSTPRDESPLLDILPSIENGPLAMDVDSSTTESLDGRSEVLIDPEFAPLYTDDEGNLVRPPFIFLDPRERYRLLQLKKSMQASEALQRRMKYMVNPSETISRKINPQSNMVETSTQTHDIAYVDKLLKFKQRRMATPKRIKNADRLKNTQGYFVGEFFYDVDKIEANAKSSNVLHGYLGTVSKPSFQNVKSKEMFAKNTTNADENEPFTKFGKNNARGRLDKKIPFHTDLKLDSSFVEKSKKYAEIIKLKEDTPVEEKKKESQSLGPSSGFKFNIKEDQLDSIIRKREHDNELIEQAKSKSAQTPFEQQKLKPDMKYSFGTHKTETSDNKIEKPILPSFSFGQKDVKKKRSLSSTSDEKPLHSPLTFGKKEELSEPKRKFTFGESKPTEITKPSLFAKSSEAKEFTFGASKIGDDKSSKPTISFGAIKNDDTANVPTFSFALSKDKLPNDKQDKSTLSIGLGKADQDSKMEKEKPLTPTFAFGQKRDEPTTSASGLFGNTSDKKEEPVNDKSFLFGGAEKKEITPKPALTFGEENKAPPNFSLEKEKKEQINFGKSDETSTGKPPFSFGAPSTEMKAENFSSGSDKQGEKPAFSFGAPRAEKKTEDISFGSGKPAEKPAFSFGDTRTKTKTEGISFGSDKSTEKPTFSFGARSTEKKTDGFSFGTDKPTEKPSIFGPSPSTPKFSFGNAENPQEVKSAAGISGSNSFGASIPSSTKRTSPAFPSTSATADDTKREESRPKRSRPAFSFDSTAAATPASKATFPLAESDSTSKPGFSFGTAAKEATPVATFGASTPQNTFGFSQPSIPNSNSNFKFAAGITPTSGNSGSFNFGTTTAPVFNNTQAAGFGSSSNINIAGNTGLNRGLSRSATPTFSFANSNTTANAGAVKGNTALTTTGAIFGQSSGVPQFSFGAPVSKEGTPDPASVFGMNNSNTNMGSQEATPFAFGTGTGISNPASVFGNPGNAISMPTPTAGFGGTPAFAFNVNGSAGGSMAPNQTPTPPLQGRMIARMRHRRR